MNALNISRSTVTVCLRVLMTGILSTDTHVSILWRIKKLVSNSDINVDRFFSPSSDRPVNRIVLYRTVQNVLYDNVRVRKIYTRSVRCIHVRTAWAVFSDGEIHVVYSSAGAREKSMKLSPTAFHQMLCAPGAL